MGVGCAQGVSAWNFDVAALKEQAARESSDVLPTIAEAPPVSAESGPQSYPLKLPANGPAEPAPGNGKPALHTKSAMIASFTCLA